MNYTTSPFNFQPPSSWTAYLAWKLQVVLTVKIQLTKTKTIEIGFPGTGESGAHAKADMTGIELYSGDTGAPAVRIVRKSDGWHLNAAALVSPPEGELPSRWEEVSRQPVWKLPKAFQSSAAALAVNSTMSSFGQASAEAILREMAQGLGHEKLPARLSGGALQPKGPVPMNRKPTLPPPGVPTSENGRRFTVKPFAEDGFHLAASLPEFQSLWISRLLPEGHRPTVSSIQVAESALMASPLLQPAFLEAKGSMLAILVRRNAIFFAGYKNGEPVLWRRCPGVLGYEAMRETIKKNLGVGEDLINDVLEDSLVDPRPALEPFLRPILQQLDLARVYLAGKHAMNTNPVLLLGLPHGASHWQHMAEDALKLHLVAAKPFDGLSIGKGLDVTHGHLYLVALGAAIAAAEVEL